MDSLIANAINDSPPTRPDKGEGDYYSWNKTLSRYGPGTYMYYEYIRKHTDGNMFEYINRSCRTWSERSDACRSIGASPLTGAQ